MKSLEYNCQEVHSGYNVLLPLGERFSRNECSGLAGPKATVFVTGS